MKLTANEVVHAVSQIYGLDDNSLEIDTTIPPENGCLVTTHKEPSDFTQLSKLSSLKGQTIKSVKVVNKGAKAYIRTESGSGMVLVSPEVKQELAPDEMLVLGLLTKQDLASVANAKKMGLI